MHRFKITLSVVLSLAGVLAQAGPLKFALAPNFFEPNPGGQTLGACHGGTVVDKAGNIYVTTDTDRGILVLISINIK